MPGSAKTPEHLSFQARVLLMGVLLSAIGNGLVLPYLFVYLHNVRGISSAITGVIVGFGALVSLSVSPLIGNLIDHWGPKPVLLVSLVVSGIGYFEQSSVHTASRGFLVMSICAIGQSAMWPSQSAIATELTTDAQRERYFGSQFALLNLGIGIGGIISSAFVSLTQPHTFEWLFRGDGISYFVYLIVALFLRDVGRRSKQERKENSERSGGWSEVLQDRVFVKVWIVATATTLLGYAQLEVGFASFATLVAHVKPSNIAWAYAANTIFIALFQLWVVKKLQKFDRAKSIALAALLWLGAWVALALSGLISGLAILMIIICQLIFAMGEMVWSPVMPSIVNQLAP
ncbi:MAG: MFS transporter, partial [Actinobacteria bacterium]|nr:MFS transporter [Actinomycetota bacterium]